MNYIFSFYGWYEILKFYIWLFDIFVLLIGKIVFKIGFFRYLIFKEINEDGFEWKIKCLNDG